MGVLIDTSVFISLERRGGRLATALESVGGEAPAIAAVTASELLHGVHRADTATRRARRQAWVEAILESVPVLPFDLAVARVHSRVWADLAASGVAIGSHDLLIAATALSASSAVLTTNIREFERVEGLRVLVW